MREGGRGLAARALSPSRLPANCTLSSPTPHACLRWSGLEVAPTRGAAPGTEANIATALSYMTSSTVWRALVPRRGGEGAGWGRSVLCGARPPARLLAPSTRPLSYTASQNGNAGVHSVTCCSVDERSGAEGRVCRRRVLFESLEKSNVTQAAAVAALASGAGLAVAPVSSAQSTGISARLPLAH